MYRFLFLLLLPALLLAACGHSRQRGSATISYTLEPDTAALTRQWGGRSESYAAYRDRLLKETQEIIASRLEEYGYSDGDVDLKIADGRISVSLKNTLTAENELARLQRLLTAGGSLDIWETYNNTEAVGVLAQINTLLDSAAAAGKNSDSLVTADSSLIGEAKARRKMEAEEKAHTHVLFNLLQINFNINPGNYQPTVISPVIAHANSKDTAQIGRYFRQENIRGVIPHNMVFAWFNEGTNTTGSPGMLALLALKGESVNKPAMQAVGFKTVGTEKDQNGNLMLAVEMKPGYAESWQRLTKMNMDKGLAMVFNGRVLCCPIVKGEIAGGKTNITGNFTTAEAKDMELMLKTSALPLSLRIAQQTIQ